MAKKIDFKKAKKLHFVGIGGIGVSAIAAMMIVEGKRVTGSDLVDSEIIGALWQKGAIVSIGQDIKDIPKDTDLIVHSTAVEVADRDFFKKLKKLPTPSISYAEALSEVSRDKFTIAVSGTHGKTTTTAMIAKILMDAGLEPTVIIGSILNETGTNFVAGGSEYLVVEVDEYQRKFLTISPKILVINNIDEDHLDYFENLADIQSAFAEFVSKVPKDGIVVTDLSNGNVIPAIHAAHATVIDYRAVEVKGLRLSLPGEHNRQNAQAALAVSGVLGIPLKKAVKALNGFKGIWRRFEYHGKTEKGAFVYDDYAHNPQKVKALLRGAREIFPKERIIAIFQPHLYSRTKTLLKGFSESFGDVDIIVLAPIFPAREPFDPTISSQILTEKIKELYPNKEIRHISDFNKIADFIDRVGERGDVVFTIGAGDIYKIIEMLIK